MSNNSLKNEYQYEYASGRPQMYDEYSRIRKGERMVILLRDFFGKEKIRKMTVLDIGGSSGIIDFVLAKHFKRVVCVDIDKGAIAFAKKKFRAKNLFFRVDDALKLSIKNDTFDVIICTHVYEHVSNQKKLFAEMYRVLKPGGACYLAATNRLWFWEAHYDLPFLSWLPKKIAHRYVSLFGKSEKYYETPRSYWSLKKLSKRFHVKEFTTDIIQNPRKYGYEDNRFSLPIFRPFVIFGSSAAKYFSPTFIWLLCKKK